MKLRIILLTLIVFQLPTICSGEELAFPFTVDQNLINEDLSNIPMGKELSSNKWFSAPATRLEIVTYMLDRFVQNEFAGYWELNRKKIEGYFDKKDMGIFPATTQTSVIFSEEMNLFFVDVNISVLGQPKKPMKEICDNILKYSMFPLRGDGYMYQNTFLGTFITKGSDDPEIVHVAETVAENLMLKVNLEANYDNKDFYFFTCYKQPRSSETHYNKSSFRRENK